MGVVNCGSEIRKQLVSHGLWEETRLGVEYGGTTATKRRNLPSTVVGKKSGWDTVYSI